MGRDWQAVLTGGDAHLGGVALAVPEVGPRGHVETPGVTVRMLLRDKRHKDVELAAFLAQTLAEKLECAVCASAGVHYEQITKDEILQVRDLTGRLAGVAWQRWPVPTGNNPKRLPAAGTDALARQPSACAAKIPLQFHVNNRIDARTGHVDSQRLGRIGKLHALR